VDVFCTSPWVPPEWIAAHGLRPRGIWNTARLRSGAVPEGACAFACAVYELARGSGAHFVWTTACDQMRRAADLAGEADRSRGFLFNLPATWQTRASKRLYESELRRLGRFLVSIGGTDPTDEQLEHMMQRFDEMRCQLRARLAASNARAGAETLADYFCGNDGCRRLEPGVSAEASTEVGIRRDDEVRPRHPERLRIGIVGGPLLPGHRPLLDAIEAAGTRVALNATEPGERCLVPSFPPSAGCRPALTRLADHYFDHAIDVFHRPDTRLHDWLAARIHQRRIAGLILWCQAGCDLWRAQAASFRDQLQVPFLMLDAGDQHAISPRELNRVAAFVESLQ
jgi:benzoyl-CoA reductase/2-hydroxyglutaryl-CoA dehydratase subunit BcrC/BadD/HgdB